MQRSATAGRGFALFGVQPARGEYDIRLAGLQLDRLRSSTAASEQFRGHAGVHAQSVALSAASLRIFRRCPKRLRIRDPGHPRAALRRGGITRLTELLDSLTDLRPLGQIHDSFIIAAGRDGLWIIDQHVAQRAHLIRTGVGRARKRPCAETQRLLVPIVIGVSAAQQIEYARIAEELNGLGFETEPFGNRTIAVKSAPAGIGAADIERVLFEILEIAESELRKASLDDLRRSMAASIACRAAIKINMRLEPEKIDWLLRALAATSCPMSCPHGRADCASLLYAGYPKRFPPDLTMRKNISS